MPLFAILFALLAVPITAQPADDAHLPDPADHPARARVSFNPPIARTLPGERYVLRHDHLLPPAPGSGPDVGPGVGPGMTPGSDKAAARYRDLARVARALDVVVLRHDPADPLTLHVYVEGIDVLARSDWLWEGMPRRCDSMQELIDLAITRCRATGRPLSHLIIVGHSGVGGTAAFGSSLDDCVFRGRLSPYHRDQLARLRPYLADDAVIEIRQCTAALGNDGTRLLTQIHQASGAAATGYFGDFYFGKANAIVRKQVDQHGVALVNR